ncbi:hypothetical protein [Paractinoplanes rishiriensis]|uniref:Uncharacterized protein n=1 Tax=Paractinoplanes rishiriensis TaxID=1050105 RepID=A0A919K5D9_9ACTN|nr:hypothetical protein [Actinoplanes rishiriensis]GIF01146.1 hypothetical protein Ari01nite_86100 [Actinoplanes rishiriensis]
MDAFGGLRSHRAGVEVCLQRADQRFCTAPSTDKGRQHGLDEFDMAG